MNYDKPGRGVSKDEAKKSPAAEFFSILGGRLGKLIQLNLLFMIPFAVVATLCVVLFTLPVTRYDLMLVKGGVTYSLSLWNFYVVTVPLILLSPFFAGITYVTRNFARREHAFVFMDSKEVIAKNWKPFFINGIFTYIVYFLLSFASVYYFVSIRENWVNAIPLAVCVMAMIIYVFMQFYVPIMIITFDLKLRQIYKNALIFSVLGLGRNLIIAAVTALSLYIIWQSLNYMLLTVVLVAVFMILIGFAAHGLLVNFCVYPVIEKYLIIPYYGDPNRTEEEKNDAFRFRYERNDDEEEEEETTQQSEYVYYNGRLIKREELQKRNDTVFTDDVK